jgi:hypothetical protein
VRFRAPLGLREETLERLALQQPTGHRILSIPLPDDSVGGRRIGSRDARGVDRSSRAAPRGLPPAAFPEAAARRPPRLPRPRAGKPGEPVPEPTRVTLSPPLVFALCTGSLLVAGLVFAALRPQAVVRHAQFVLVLVALVSAAALLALVRLDPPGLRLTIDPSTEPMLRARDPAKEEYRAAVRDFGDDGSS